MASMKGSVEKADTDMDFLQLNLLVVKHPQLHVSHRVEEEAEVQAQEAVLMVQQAVECIHQTEELLQ